jgi:hypothetical protein
VLQKAKALSPDQHTVQSPASFQLTLANSQLRWWWWWLLLVNRWVRLEMVECLEYNLHEQILSGYELLYLGIVVGVAIAGLTIALIVPCVHHLRDLGQERYKFSRIKTPTICCDFFINLYLKVGVMDKVPKHATTHIKSHKQDREHQNTTQGNDS